MSENMQQLFLTISDADLREQLIFKQDYNPDAYALGGIRRFENLSFHVATELMERGYLSPEDKQNYAPTAQEFVRFMATHNPENWLLIGYSVSPKRKDVRVTIEGIKSIGPVSDHDMADFLRIFRQADALTANDGEPVSCWFD